MPIVVEFLEERFPERVSWGASGGLGFKTVIAESGSGDEQRDAKWSIARGKWDISKAMETDDDFFDVRKFFYACHGKAVGFRFKDWADYTDEGIGTARNTTGNVYQLGKTYAVGQNSYVRDIKKPVEGTVKIFVSGVERTTGLAIDYTKGLVTFDAPPGGIVTWTGEFDCACRFDTDEMRQKLEFYNGSAAEFPIVELKRL